MKKKLFVVALMAALSTVGYGFEYPNGDTMGNSTVGGKVENLNSLDKNFDSWEVRDKINGNINSIVEATDKNFNTVKDGITSLEGKLNQKVDKTELDSIKNEIGNLTDFRNETSEAVGKLQNQIISTNEDIENIKGNIEKDKLAQEKRDEEQDGKIHNVSQRLENFKDQVNSDNAAQNDNIRDNAAAIEDLKDSKLDKGTYETDKAAQKVTDDNQNSKIEANSQAIEANKNAIIETNKKVEANSQAIETNKNAITETNKKVEANSQAIVSNSNRIDNLENGYAQVNGRISGLEKKVDNLDNKMNKGLSLMAAMNAVDFQNVETGEMALGAGIGHYGNAQSVALGVAYSPVEDLTVNAKYSVTAGSPDSFALGAGATYKFKVGR